MKIVSRPPVVRSPIGNSEERAAQIAHITERLDRIGGSAHQVAAELASLAREIQTLREGEAATLPEEDHAKLSN